MAQNQIRLDGNGSAPKVEVNVATDARGTCRVRAWDPNGRHPEQKLKFDFDGTKSEEEPLLDDQTAVKTLDKCTLTWSVRLGPRQAGASGRYEVRVRVKQGERTAPGGEFVYSGPLDRVEEIGDAALFMVP